MSATKTILLIAVCSVASFLIGSAARVDGAGDDDPKPLVANRQPPVGRYQMIAVKDDFKVFDTMTGRYWRRGRTGFVESDPIGNSISEAEEEQQLQELKERLIQRAREREIQEQKKKVDAEE